MRCAEKKSHRMVEKFGNEKYNTAMFFWNFSTTRMVMPCTQSTHCAFMTRLTKEHHGTSAKITSNIACTGIAIELQPKQSARYLARAYEAQE
jgi:hypothetical protein